MKPKANWTLPDTHDPGADRAARTAHAMTLTEDQREFQRRCKGIGFDFHGGITQAYQAMDRFSICITGKAGQANKSTKAAIAIEWWDEFARFVREGMHTSADWHSFIPKH